MSIKEPIFTIPNFLSGYRILAFPLLLWFLFSKNEDWFVIFLIINLLTDILDGLVARLFKLQTKLGARLDSIGDIGTYIAAFIGVYLFKWDDLTGNLTPFLVFLSVFVLMYILSLLKFGKVPSLHLYSFKTCGYVQGIFFAVLFLSGFHLWFYHVAMACGIIATLEEILVILWLKELRSDVKGLYWVIKSQPR